jgi:hypothetical protein
LLKKFAPPYEACLSAGIEDRIEWLKKFGPPNEATKGLSATVRDVDGEPSIVEINSESDLWPRDDEAVIGNPATFFVFAVDIFKKPVALEEYQQVSGASDFGASSIIPTRSDLKWDRKKNDS